MPIKMDSKDSNYEESTTVKLKKSIGLTTGCSLIIGGIIGSGIFVTPQGVLLGAGSYGLSLIIWAICGVLSLCGALTYAEMGTIIPKSGSAYYYIMEIYGDCAAFVYMFTSLLFVLPSGIAIVALTCAEYLSSMFFTDGCGAAPEHITQALATSLILFVAAINAKSVTLSGNVSVMFTIAKVSALGVIIVGGLIKLAQGATDYLSPDKSFQDTSTSVASIAEAFLSGMWAYSGWEGLNFMIEELKKPEQDLPRAVFISIPVVTIFYLLTNVAYFSVLAPEEIMSSTAVAVTWANSVIPNVAWFIPLAVAVSTFGASSGSLLLNSRLAFVAARECHLPSMFSMVHITHFTPAPAVLLLTVLSVMYIYLGTIVQLIGYTGVAVWIFHGMVGIGVLILRVKEKDISRPYKVHLICPVLLILFSLLLSFGPIIGNPQWGYFFALSVIVAGMLVWVLCIKYGVHMPGMDSLTKVIQLYMQISPAELSQSDNAWETQVTRSQQKYGSTDCVMCDTKMHATDDQDVADVTKL